MSGLVRADIRPDCASVRLLHLVESVCARVCASVYVCMCTCTCVGVCLCKGVCVGAYLCVIFVSVSMQNVRVCVCFIAGGV